MPKQKAQLRDMQPKWEGKPGFGRLLDKVYWRLMGIPLSILKIVLSSTCVLIFIAV